MVNFLHRATEIFKSKKAMGRQNDHLRGLLVKNTLLKSRSPVTTGLMSGTVIKNGLFEPLVDTRLLIWAAENNWMLGTAIDKIHVETTKEGYEWLPKFASKCAKCGATYDEAEPEECENCGGSEFVEPNRKQLKYIEQLFAKPNTDEQGRVIKTFMDIVGDLVHYKETIDDYYLETSFNNWGNPAELMPMSSEQIRIAVDDSTRGLFCPNCYEPDEVYTDKRDTCPKCGFELVETKYVQLEGNTKNVEMRWGDKNVLHSNSRAWGNRVYGIPKIWSVWATAQTLKWMEYYNWSAYSQNKMPDSFTVFPGMSTQQVNRMVEEVVAWKEKNPQTKKSVWLGSEAGGAPVHVQTMFSMKDMMSLETAQFYREAISIRYGVSLQLLGIQTPGKLGSETEVVEVSYDTIIEVQRQISEFINNKLVPLFKYPEPITDWKFALISPKKDDELRKANIKATNINSVVALRSSGIDAALNPQTFEIDIRSQPEPLPPQDNYIPFQNSIEKALTPRNIDQDVAIDEIRQIEDEFAQSVIAEYDDTVKEIMAEKLSKEQRLSKLEALKTSVVDKIRQHAQAYYTQAYMLGLQEELKDFKDARFTQPDVNAIKLMQDNPKGMFNSITTFGEREVEKFREIIENAYKTDFDLDKMVKEMQEATGGGRSALERIARTETTRISNTARAVQWEKYADPEAKEYYWNYGTGRHGSRTCDRCRAIGDGSPYTLNDLREITNGFLVHPNDRCTVSRRPGGRK